MSYILGIDTSSRELGVALANEQEGLLSISRYMRNSHAEHISKSVEFLLTTCGINVLDISKVAIAVGPGSFTGLRIGISFVKGLCFGRSIKVLPVSSLECIAHAWNGREKPLTTVLDARNGDVFWARFYFQDTALVRTHEDTVSTIEEFRQKNDDDVCIVSDTLGNAKSTVFDFLKDRPNAYALEHYPLQRGLACTRAAIQACHDPLRWVSASEISPKYLSITSMEKKLHHQQAAIQ